MNKKIICIAALSVALGTVKTVQAQYPKIPPAMQAKSDSALDEAKKRSDVAWAKALPIIQRDEKAGKPYIPGLINRRICHRPNFRRFRVPRVVVCIPRAAVVDA
jgi:hypothetical protein